MPDMSSGSDVLPRRQAPTPATSAREARSIRSIRGGPLAERHIALTWSVEQGQFLSFHLEAAGAHITPLFAGAGAAVRDTTTLDAALLQLNRYDRIVLTSLAGVDAFANRLVALGMGPDACRDVYIAMLFPVTARAQALAALPPQLVPAPVLADDIEAGLREIDGKRLLLLRAERMHDTLAESLRAHGAEVDEVAAYQMIAHPVDALTLHRVLVHSPVDAIVCTSAAMVDGLLMGLPAIGPERAQALRNIPLIALDDGAAARLRQNGLAATVASPATTLPGAVAPTPLLQPLIAALESAMPTGAARGRPHGAPPVSDSLTTLDCTGTYDEEGVLFG